MKTLKVLAVDGHMVPDLEAAMGGFRRFVGRERVHPWSPKLDPVSVPASKDMVAAVKAGELMAADEDTAKLCGVKWF
jgi:hypothetical protein